MTNHSFTNAEGKMVQRQACEIYTRVMGYLRPVSNFNIGKKSEFYSRKCFEGVNVCNSKFAAQYTK